MTPEAPVPAVQMAEITKTYPGGVVANDGLALAAFAGEIHAVIGENGAGKSTLMGILYGSIRADSGRIRIRGRDERIESPARAIALGIAYVSQHTSVIPALTLWENATLGDEPSAAGIVSRRVAVESLERVSEPLGVKIDWGARACESSVATLQKVEIVKAMRRGATILILDEPTPTLAPPEVEALFSVLRGLAGRGATVLLVTHRLREVMSHATRVTVLRAGKPAGERMVADTSEDDLLAMMLGPRVGMPLVHDAAPEHHVPVTWDDVFAPARTTAAPSAQPMPRLEVRDVSVTGDRHEPVVSECSLTVAAGEILGVSGVDGNGQRELAQAIVGLRTVLSGTVALNGRDVTRRSVRARTARGLAYVPEDRLREGLVPDFSVAENLELGLADAGMWLDRYGMDWSAREAISEYQIAASSPRTTAATLSGGNQQKLLLARALNGEPSVIVAMQPTRGLDVASTRFVYARLRDARARGAAILLFSLDLDEILEASDRIAVMFGGRIVGVLTREQATAETIGRLMVGAEATPEATDG